MNSQKIRITLVILFVAVSFVYSLKAQTFNPPRYLKLSEWCYNYNFLWSAPESQSAEFLYYNLYCDSTFIDSTLLNYYTYEFDSGYHSFGVSAVYDGGESEILSRDLIAPLGKTPNMPSVIDNRDRICLGWWGVCYFFGATYMNNYTGGYGGAGLADDSVTYAIKWTWYNGGQNFIAEFVEFYFMPTIISGSGALDFHFKIIQGDSAQELIYFQVLEDIQYDDWNVAVLDPPLIINTSENIYIGVTAINDLDNNNVGGIAVDYLSPDPGYGNLMSLDDSTWSQGPTGDWVMEGNYTNALWNGNRADSSVRERDGIVTQYDVYRDGEYIGSTESIVYCDSNFTPDDCGQYFEYYLVAQHNNCTSPPSDTIGDILDCFSNINGIDKSDRIKTFPNPANDILFVKSFLGVEEVIINNSFGKEIFHKTIADQQSVQIDCSVFSQGIYFITIRSMNQFYTRKFVVIH